MIMVRYRVGLSTILVDGRGVGELSMCRADAPDGWHSQVLFNFEVTGSNVGDTWPRACEIAEGWIGRFKSRERPTSSSSS